MEVSKLHQLKKKNKKLEDKNIGMHSLRRNKQKSSLYDSPKNWYYKNVTRFFQVNFYWRLIY